MLEREFGDRTGDDDFPLFPDRLGYELRPECVVLFIEAIATLIGETLFTAKGVRRFGKHSLRASGAVHLALMGISVEKIRLIGRWMCGVVIHYTRTAPLNTLAADYKRTRDEKSTSTTIKNLTKNIVQVGTYSESHHRRLRGQVRGDAAYDQQGGETGHPT